jgi:hypothetical protein
VTKEVESKIANADEKKKAANLKKATSPRRLDAETGRLLQQIKEKANKKTHGRKVRESQILAYAVRLIQPEHIKDLQAATLSERDRLQIQFEEFQKTSGKLSMDEFIGKLLRGEVAAMSMAAK